MAPTHPAVRCVVITPERPLLDESVDFVAVPLYDGELGVLPGRTPLIGRLGYGELRLRKGERTTRYFVDGGFAQIRDNVVTVLTPSAQKAEDIDLNKAREVLRAPATPPATPEAQEARLRELDRARAQIRVVEHTQSP